MTKKEIFDKIVEVSAEVCSVSVDDIIGGARKEDVVTARALTVFWLDAAGLSVESIVTCVERNNANSINSIKARQEELWSSKFAYHVLAREIGKRLLEYAQSIGEDFDVNLPLKRMSKTTGKY